MFDDLVSLHGESNPTLRIFATYDVHMAYGVHMKNILIQNAANYHEHISDNFATQNNPTPNEQN